MNCPKCGSENIVERAVTITETTSKIKGFDCIKACIGWLLFSLPGVLCGLCGMGKGKVKTTQTTKVVKTCQNCGHQF